MFLQQTAITDIRLTFNNKYLVASTDDGNVYILESFRVVEGMEKIWTNDHQDF